MYFCTVLIVLLNISHDSYVTYSAAILFIILSHPHSFRYTKSAVDADIALYCELFKVSLNKPQYVRQWRTQEFCSGGRVQQIQLRTEDSENGDLGAVAP